MVHYHKPQVQHASLIILIIVQKVQFKKQRIISFPISKDIIFAGIILQINQNYLLIYKTSFRCNFKQKLLKCFYRF